MRRWLLTTLIMESVLCFAASPARADSSAAIFLYHHVDDDTPASTSVLPSEFRAQLDYLAREGFSVLPLMDLIGTLARGGSVPERSVAITFDDAYDSILDEALPMLEARGWPFTVLVNTEAIDEGYGGYLSWDELRQLGRHGATIGNHSVTHSHLVRVRPGESKSDWRQRVTAEISDANRRLSKELGADLIPVFAYPYGEYTAELETIVDGQGLYGLGQQSGAFGPGSDFLALPRYPVATGLDLEADFALRAVSRPLPVTLVGDERHVLEADDARPPLRLQLGSDRDIRVAQLACYATGQGRMALEWQDDAMHEFVARPDKALGPGRSKYNCTAPSRSRPGVYYWYSYLWMRKRADGRWYDE